MSTFTLSAIKEIMAGRTQQPKTFIKAASEAQINYYTQLCTKAKIVPQTGLSAVEISAEIARVKLLAVNSATDNQKAALLTNKELLSISVEDIDVMDFNTASKLLEEVSKLTPPSDAQWNRIIDCYRFGLIPVISTKMTKFMASKIISSYEDKLKAFALFATYPQVEKIRSLQDKLGDVQMDEKELSKLTKVQASELISALMCEVEALKEVKQEEYGTAPEALYTDSDRGVRGSIVDMAGATRTKLWRLIHSEILGQTPEAYSETALVSMLEYVITFAESELEYILNDLMD